MRIQLTRSKEAQAVSGDTLVLTLSVHDAAADVQAHKASFDSLTAAQYSARR